MGVDADCLFTPGDPAAKSRYGCCLGRLGSQKDLLLLLRALPAILSTFPPVGSKVIGDGSQKPARRPQRHSLGCFEGRVCWRSAQLRIANFCSSQICLCFLHWVQEGLGLVCAEALACGCKWWRRTHRHAIWGKWCWMGWPAWFSHGRLWTLSKKSIKC